MEGYEPKRPAADTATTDNLKHLARLLDRGEPLSLRINGRRVALPAGADFAIDLDRDPRSGCVEVDIRWSLPVARQKDSTKCVSADAANASSGEAADKRQGTEPRADSNTLSRAANRAPHIRLKALITAPTI